MNYRPNTADAVAMANHETVHAITMAGLDNAHRVALFRETFKDQLPPDQLTDIECISAMCTVELECYS